MLLETLKQDLLKAQKEKDEIKVSIVRYLLSQVNYARIAKQADLTDDDIVREIGKEIKRHEESIAAFTNGGRPELAHKEEVEATILRSYMPEQMADDQLETLITATIAQAGAMTMKDMGNVMTQLSGKLQGRADMSKVSQIVRSKLQ